MRLFRRRVGRNATNTPLDWAASDSLTHSIARSVTDDPTVANRVADRLWNDSLRKLDADQFVRHASEVRLGMSPMRVDYVKKMVEIDTECDRRKLEPPPPLIDISRAKVEFDPNWSETEKHFMAANALRWELNACVASGQASEAQRLEACRAEAENARALRRMEQA